MGDLKILTSVTLATLLLLLQGCKLVISRPPGSTGGTENDVFSKDYNALQNILGQHLAGTSTEKSKVIDLLLQLLEEIDLPTLCEVIINDTKKSNQAALRVPIKYTKIDVDLLNSLDPQMATENPNSDSTLQPPSTMAMDADISMSTESYEQMAIQNNGEESNDHQSGAKDNSHTPAIYKYYTNEFNDGDRISSQETQYAKDDSSNNVNYSEELSNSVMSSDDSKENPSNDISGKDLLNDGQELHSSLLKQKTASDIDDGNTMKAVGDLKQMYLKSHNKNATEDNEVLSGYTNDINNKNILVKHIDVERPRAQLFSHSLVLGDWTNKNRFDRHFLTTYTDNEADVKAMYVPNHNKVIASDAWSDNVKSEYKTRFNPTKQQQQKYARRFLNSHDNVGQMISPEMSTLPNTQSTYDPADFSHSITPLENPRQVDYIEELRSTLMAKKPNGNIPTLAKDADTSHKDGMASLAMFSQMDSNAANVESENVVFDDSNEAATDTQQIKKLAAYSNVQEFTDNNNNVNQIDNNRLAQENTNWIDASHFIPEIRPTGKSDELPYEEQGVTVDITTQTSPQSHLTTPSTSFLATEPQVQPLLSEPDNKTANSSSTQFSQYPNEMVTQATSLFSTTMDTEILTGTFEVTHTTASAVQEQTVNETAKQNSSFGLKRHTSASNFPQWAQSLFTNSSWTDRTHDPDAIFEETKLDSLNDSVVLNNEQVKDGPSTAFLDSQSAQSNVTISVHVLINESTSTDHPQMEAHMKLANPSVISASFVETINVTQTRMTGDDNATHAWVTTNNVKQDEVRNNEATQAGVTNSDIIQAGVTNSDVTQAGVTISDSTQTGVSNNEVTQAGITTRDATQGGVTTSDVTQIEFTNDNATQSGVTNSDATQAGVTNGNVTQAGVTNSDVTQAGVTNDNVTHAGVTNSDVTQTEVTNSDVTQAGVTNSDVTQAGVTNGDVSQTGITNSDATQAEFTNNTTQAGTTNIDVTQVELTNNNVTQAGVTNSDVTQVEFTNNTTQAGITNTDVTQAELTNNNVTQAEVTSDEIIQAGVTNSDATQAAFTNNILPQAEFANNVTQARVTSDEITQAGDASDEITQAEVTYNDVIQTGVTNSDVTQIGVSSNVVMQARMRNNNVTQTLVSNNEVTQAEVTNSDVTQATVTNNNVTQTEVSNNEVIQPGVSNSDVIQVTLTKNNVTQTEVNNNEVTQAGVTNSDVTQAGVSNSDVTQATVTNNNVTQTEISNNEVTQDGVSNSDVTQADVSNNEVIQAGVSNSDITQAGVSNNDVTQTEVSNNEVTQAGVSNSDVTQATVTNNNVTQTEISNNEVTEAGVSNSDVTQATVTNNNVTQTEISNNEVTQSGVSNSDVTQATVTNNNVTQTEISNNEVTEAGVSNSDVTQATVTNNNVTQTEISNNEVTQSGFSNSDVTQAEVSNNEVTQAEVTDPDVISANITDTITDGGVANKDVPHENVTDNHTSPMNFTNTAIQQSPVFDATTEQSPVFDATTEQSPVFDATTEQSPMFDATTDQIQYTSPVTTAQENYLPFSQTNNTTVLVSTNTTYDIASKEESKSNVTTSTTDENSLPFTSISEVAEEESALQEKERQNKTVSIVNVQDITRNISSNVESNTATMLNMNISLSAYSNGLGEDISQNTSYVSADTTESGIQGGVSNINSTTDNDVDEHVTMNTTVESHVNTTSSTEAHISASPEATSAFTSSQTPAMTSTVSNTLELEVRSYLPLVDINASLSMKNPSNDELTSQNLTSMPENLTVAQSLNEILGSANTTEEVINTTTAAAASTAFSSELPAFTQMDSTGLDVNTTTIATAENITIDPTENNFNAAPKFILEKTVDFDNFIQPTIIEYGSNRKDGLTMEISIKEQSSETSSDETASSMNSVTAQNNPQITGVQQTDKEVKETYSLTEQSTTSSTSQATISFLATSLTDSETKTANVDIIEPVTPGTPVNSGTLSQVLRGNITTDNLKMISSKIAETKANLSRINMDLMKPLQIGIPHDDSTSESPTNTETASIREDTNISSAKHETSEQVAFTSESTNTVSTFIDNKSTEVTYVVTTAVNPTEYTTAESTTSISTVTDAAPSTEIITPASKSSTSSVIAISSTVTIPSDSIHEMSTPTSTVSSNKPHHLKDSTVNILDGYSGTSEYSNIANADNLLGEDKPQFSSTLVPASGNWAKVYDFPYLPIKRKYPNKPSNHPYMSQFADDMGQTKPHTKPVLDSWKVYNIAVGKAKTSINNQDIIDQSGAPEIHLYSNYRSTPAPVDNLRNYLWQARPWPKNTVENLGQDATYNRMMAGKPELYQNQNMDMSKSVNFQRKTLNKINSHHDQVKKIANANIWGNRFSQGYYGRVFDDQSNGLNTDDSTTWPSFHSRDMVNFDTLGDNLKYFRGHNQVQSIKNKRNNFNGNLRMQSSHSFDLNQRYRYLMKTVPQYHNPELDQETHINMQHRRADTQPEYAAAWNEDSSRDEGQTETSTVPPTEVTGFGRTDMSTHYNGVPAPEDYTCPGLFGYHKDPKNCQAFFICSWGMAHRVVCPPGTLYNSKEAVCDWAVNIRCTVTPDNSKSPHV